jgi:two-component system chemotaxis sensor kinase CheA
MDAADDNLIREFVEESLDHCANAERRLLEMETNEGASVDLGGINDIFRAIHSVKGAAAFLGFRVVEALSHRMENLLNDIRGGERRPTSAIVDALLRSTDLLNGLLRDVHASNDADVSEAHAALDAAEKESAGGSSDSASTSPAAPVLIESENVASPSSGAPTSSVPPTVASKAEAGAKHVESSVRVAVGTLDRLMTLAGELVLSRNQLVQTIDSTESAGLHAVGARIDRVTSELQEAIMQTRMQPIGNVFSRFPRLVRDLSKKLGKQCELIISGDDVELDKTIVEGIGDPLTHIVRNSVDHGLETPERREQGGKNPSGTIRLSAFHEAGKVVIAIQDDGAGIDAAKLKQKALAKGILTETQAAAMSDGEAVRLIFHPGFSTAEVVTDVSGRGVGMDVVRSNIEGLGGWVDVLTEVGRGTTIRITLPLTLAIVPSLLIRADGDQFAIPQANIVELVRLRADDVARRIERVKRSEVLRLRGELLPLVRLAPALGLREVDATAESHVANVVVVESGKLRYGIVVDGLQDSEEIVVKPLGRHLKDCRSLAGATVLGDGQVALILDVAGIASHLKIQLREESVLQGDVESQRTETVESQSLLMFANDPSERFALLMAVISRIERVRADAIETVSGREILQSRGSALPLIGLDRYLDAKPRPANSRVYVAVFKTAGREIGLIVPEILDIRETTAVADAVTLSAEGVMGSLTIDEKTVRIVDAYALARKAYPDYFRSEPKVELQRERTYRILLAEDSNFFRAHVSEFLRESGFEVVECVDGQHAWETLRGGEEIDLVVTDVEMPRMDGIEFCRRIKSDPLFDGLKVIALTSLAGEEDARRGRENGVDSYQIKMDRETLLGSIKQLLGKSSRVSRSSRTEAFA